MALARDLTPMIDFDEVIDRRDTHSQKWDELEKGYGVSPDGGIPLWVADMDFRAPPPVNEALQQMVDHGIHGYYGDDLSFRAAMAGWMKRRHGWTIEPDWALQTHGLVNAIAMVIQASFGAGRGRHHLLAGLSCLRKDHKRKWPAHGRITASDRGQ